MRTLGLIGGLSWESSALYYRLINEEVKRRLGGLHSARILLYSFDFAEIAEMQANDRWEEAGAKLADVAERLQSAGAEALVLCTNTMHKVAAAIEARATIPLLHIADPTAASIRAQGFERVGLLGTRFTMEQAFYRKRLAAHGIETLVPSAQERASVHRIIYEELCVGRVVDTSRDVYRGIVERLSLAGAQAIVLGCTEIGMLLRNEDVSTPLFDTTVLHASAAAHFAIE
jgi:aspartate racemase